MFQNFIVTDNDADASFGHRSSTLSVPKVNLSHSGNFTCTVHSESGVGAASARLKVLGRFNRVIKIDFFFL